MATFKEAEKVIAFPNGDKRVGFIVDGPHGDEEKYNIQIGETIHSGFGYRVVPGDAEGKTGATFRRPGEGA